MATVRVKIDDLAIGDLPLVCAKTGRRADGFVEFEARRGGLRAWWVLLLLLGPIGWVAFAAAIGFGRRVNRVGGSLPLSSAALERYNSAVIVGRVAFVGTLTLLLVGIGVALRFGGSWSGAPELGWFSLAAFAVGFVVTMVAGIVIRHSWVDAELDGSGRWVALRGVHPDFAGAVEFRYRPATRVDSPAESVVPPLADQSRWDDFSRGQLATNFSVVRGVAGPAQTAAKRTSTMRR